MYFTREIKHRFSKTNWKRAMTHTHTHTVAPGNQGILDEQTSTDGGERETDRVGEDW